MQVQIQLQKCHFVESLAIRKSSCTRKSPSREFSYKQMTCVNKVPSRVQTTMQRVQLQTNHPLESSATNKSPCREFTYRHITLWKIHLQNTSHHVEKSATSNHPVESSATNKSPVWSSSIQKKFTQ